jgi:ketosteroid isomerase-like protein
MGEQHANVARMRAAIEAFSDGDLGPISGVLADDIVWHVGGDHPLSGEYQGRQSVIGYLQKARELTEGTLHLEVEEVLANERHGAAFVRATGERGGQRVDVTLAEMFTFDERGHWREYWALADDQTALDRFWR